MTELASRANAVATSAGDLPVIKSTSCACPGEGTVVDSLVFRDILADVAHEPPARDGETSDRSPFGETCGANLSPGVFPTGLPQTMTQLIASLSSPPGAGSPPQGSGVTPAQVVSGALPQSSLSMTGELDEAIRFENPVDLRAASCRRPELNSREPSAWVTSGFSARLSASAGEETDAVRAQGGAALLTGTPESAAGHQAPEDQEADDVLARRSDFAVRSTIDMMPEALAGPIPEPTFALPIHVTALETYLPAMIVRTAVELAAPTENVGRMTAGTSPTEQPGAIRMKILTFDMHPAALGPLTVRMRISGKQMEIAIDVRTEEVRAMLTQTREAMIEALAGHGLRLETPDIRLAAPPPAIEPKPAIQDQNATADAGSLMQDGGRDHHDRRHASPRHGSPGEERSRKALHRPLDADKPIGIYL